MLSWSAAICGGEPGPNGTALAAAQLGLVTHKDCERALAEGLGIPERRGHFWGMRGSNRLEDCTILLVVSTPALRPDHMARLVRAYYHADPQVIAESSESTED